jgi:hypothetical protein
MGGSQGGCRHHYTYLGSHYTFSGWIIRVESINLIFRGTTLSLNNGLTSISSATIQVQYERIRHRKSRLPYHRLQLIKWNICNVVSQHSILVLQIILHPISHVLDEIKIGWICRSFNRTYASSSHITSCQFGSMRWSVVLHINRLGIGLAQGLNLG